MKEFEKWNTKTMPNISPPNLAHSVLFIKEQRKESWRASLEWVLKNCPLSHIGREKIEEELGEE
ncbi:MAG: hypothetical protein JSW06_01900 [Thermoplasmatales archaeon]|nr:MAG: hypothetical protein JSW06_01900 [Thermoplasmatales archaeon]